MIVRASKASIASCEGTVLLRCLQKCMVTTSATLGSYSCCHPFRRRNLRHREVNPPAQGGYTEFCTGQLAPEAVLQPPTLPGHLPQPKPSSAAAGVAAQGVNYFPKWAEVTLR